MCLKCAHVVLAYVELDDVADVDALVEDHSDSGAVAARDCASGVGERGRSKCVLAMLLLVLVLDGGRVVDMVMLVMMLSMIDDCLCAKIHPNRLAVTAVAIATTFQNTRLIELKSNWRSNRVMNPFLK